MLGSMARGIVALAMLAGGSVSATGQEVDARTKQTGPRGGSVTRERSLDRGGGTATAARGTRIEGPRGAALERQIRIERGPGTVERSTAIVRPGGSTFERDVRVARSGIAPPAPGPRVIQRNLTINRCGPAFPPPRGGSFSNFSLFLGAPAFFPPPLVVAPVAVAAPPVVVVEPAPPVVVEQAPPAVVEVVPPQRYRSQPEAIRVDPVFEGLRRLHSGHDNSRRDGAVTLGRLGDGRAVKPLMDRLRFDEDRDVRAAAAWALGEIGDPQAAPYLERAAISDKKREVRDEAARALDRLEYVRSLPAGSEGAAPVVLPQPTRAVRPEVPPPPPPMPPGEERPIFEALPEALPDIDPGPAA